MGGGGVFGTTSRAGARSAGGAGINTITGKARVRKYGPGGTLGQKPPGNWTKYITDHTGETAENWMTNPHGHHIMFKEGLSEAQKELVEELKDILEHYDIDWFLGTSAGSGKLDNLIIAENRGHRIENLMKV